tara:strand:- start:239 stop:556 length:318 start_codon:yes stop_codon:yes gene_type:complete
MTAAAVMTAAAMAEKVAMMLPMMILMRRAKTVLAVQRPDRHTAIQSLCSDWWGCFLEGVVGVADPLSTEEKSQTGVAAPGCSDGVHSQGFSTARADADAPPSKRP